MTSKCLQLPQSKKTLHLPCAQSCWQRMHPKTKWFYFTSFCFKMDLNLYILPLRPLHTVTLCARISSPLFYLHLLLWYLLTSPFLHVLWPGRKTRRRRWWLIWRCHLCPSNINQGKMGQRRVVSGITRSPQLVLWNLEELGGQSRGVVIQFVPKYRNAGSPYRCWTEDRNSNAFLTTLQGLKTHRNLSHGYCLCIASDR